MSETASDLGLYPRKKHAHEAIHAHFGVPVDSSQIDSQNTCRATTIKL